MTQRYDLVVQGRSLVVLDQQPELIDIALDTQIKQTLEEVTLLQGQVDGLERSIGTVLHTLGFRYPEIAERLRQKLNAFRELQGMVPLSDDVDPFSQRDKTGKMEAEEQAKLDADAEEAAKAAIAALDEKDLTPAQRKAKFIERKRKEKCKRLYLKLARMTHPDKVKDPELNNIFHQAKKAYEALDLDVLTIMHKDVKDYTNIKGHRGKFRDFKHRRLQHSLGQKNMAITSLNKLKSSLAYECKEAVESGDPIKTRKSYDDFIDEQCYRVDNAIEDIRWQMRVQRSEASQWKATTVRTE